MIITGMAHFESVCKKKLVEWYNENGYADTPQTPPADLSNVFVVWSCKTLQNYIALLSTTFSGDGIYFRLSKSFFICHRVSLLIE